MICIEHKYKPHPQCWIPLQVNICDDYSLPVDFVKKRPSSLEQCRDVKFADDFPSPSIHNEQQVCNITIIIHARIQYRAKV